MRRREFITLLGGAAAAWPVAARAQQSEQMRRIGVLMNTGADESESQARLAAFMQGLQELGWAAGRNLRIDHRWSPGDLARLRKDAAELVALRPEVILAGVVPLRRRRELKARTDTSGEASLRGHLKSEGAEQTGSQSYIPPDPKDDKALHTALDLLRGIQKNSAYPPNPKTAVPN